MQRGSVKWFNETKGFGFITVSLPASPFGLKYIYCFFPELAAVIVVVPILSKVFFDSV